MFTGLVEEIGSVRSIERYGSYGALSICAPLIAADLVTGDSVAVNGVCLSATAVDKGGFKADVMHETVSRSSLARLRIGSHVNLERAMPCNGRFGGHIVTGHVDGTGVISSVRADGNALLYTIRADKGLLRHIVEKGSVTIDGISLTVADLMTDGFIVSVIPHTASVTILGEKRASDIVNIETDIIGKYIDRLLNNKKSGISLDFLKENGF